MAEVLLDRGKGDKQNNQGDDDHVDDDQGGDDHVGDGQVDDDQVDDDHIYIMMKCLCVCNEK